MFEYSKTIDRNLFENEIIEVALPVQCVHLNLEYLDQPKEQLRCRYYIAVIEQLYPIVQSEKYHNILSIVHLIYQFQT